MFSQVMAFVKSKLKEFPEVRMHNSRVFSSWLVTWHPAQTKFRWTAAICLLQVVWVGIHNSKVSVSTKTTPEIGSSCQELSLKVSGANLVIQTKFGLDDSTLEHVVFRCWEQHLRHHLNIASASHSKMNKIYSINEKSQVPALMSFGSRCYVFREVLKLPLNVIVL